MSKNSVVLKFSCDDRPGIVAAIATFFSELGYNIKESSQFEDGMSKRFFMRTEFDSTVEGTDAEGIELDELRASFQLLADRYGCPVIDRRGRPVDRSAWDFQDLERFVAAAPRDATGVLRG